VGCSDTFGFETSLYILIISMSSETESSGVPTPSGGEQMIKNATLTEKLLATNPGVTKYKGPLPTSMKG